MSRFLKLLVYHCNHSLSLLFSTVSWALRIRIKDISPSEDSKYPVVARQLGVKKWPGSFLRGGMSSTGHLPLQVINWSSWEAVSGGAVGRKFEGTVAQALRRPGGHLFLMVHLLPIECLIVSSTNWLNVLGNFQLLHVVCLWSNSSD